MGVVYVGLYIWALDGVPDLAALEGRGLVDLPSTIPNTKAGTLECVMTGWTLRTSGTQIQLFISPFRIPDVSGFLTEM